VKVVRSRGQQGIDGDRAREIQEALIRQRYLDGEPSGEWDQSTRDAMTRFQAANGWQTKNVPDARALIKLGLGPNHSGILNPDTAAIVNPALIDSTRMTTPGGAAGNSAF
jgi:peptidoglycan hydrolase-like protein with peptidoglycan-binding domain